MNKEIILIIIFSLILLILISLTYLLFFISKNNQKQTQLCFRNDCFNVELALTPKEREQGLMFRNYLGENEGMLFIFAEEEEYSFWMKNTLISLDIIWLNKDKEVVFVSKNNQPCKNDECPKISSSQKAKYVLELNKGIADKIGLEIGDRANFNIEQILSYNID